MILDKDLYAGANQHKKIRFQELCPEYTELNFLVHIGAYNHNVLCISVGISLTVPYKNPNKIMTAKRHNDKMRDWQS